MAPKVSIIVLTFNSAAYIERLIKSILDFNNGLSFEIIVVDNKSSDNTVEKIKDYRLEIKELKLVENKENVGFAKGINLGSKSAEGEYLLFINPDAEFKSGNIENLVEVFEKEKSAGIVGGKIVTNDQSAENSAGKLFDFSTTIATLFGLDNALGLRFSPDTVTKVGFVSGAFMMIKKDVFEMLDGFDENYFMYVEDVDLSLRVKKAGFSTFFTPAAVLLHASHGSSSRSFAISNIYKNMIYYHRKNSSFLVYLVVRFVLILKAVTLVLIAKILNNKSLSLTYEEAFKISLR